MKTYIVNVSTNLQRKNHMLEMLKQHDCLHDVHFMHEGDLDSITNQPMSSYFGGLLNEPSPTVSCAYKHLLIYEAMHNDTENEYALILEDDIFLDDHCCTMLSNIIAEIARRDLKNILISLEDSNLKYVERSQRIENQFLYAKERGRMAGAYLIDKTAAKSMLDEVLENKCNVPIDWFHNHCCEKGLLQMYWAHPTIACQGSLNGKLHSLIDNKQTGLYKIWKFGMSRVYKQCVYFFR
jgi:glycosyl transferase family 25